ncbi:MAG: TetR/AcrR family transcriptional regulator [Pseudopedobacter saltans]|uniref:TetR/AcrR family transcriptional regulator n=1 Tax=Pseudopedobacter saltans TaxID=151895 RepID=A0A2W5EV07_9SPHI|nr:MAG: TetR/AcrR family transcriptional regulator [Pseudopedobacter saltans]
MESKSKVTKEYIINQAKEVFVQLGYTSVTMADIATATQMGRSSLYYYFKNKEEVFFAIAEDEFSHILAKAKTKIKSNHSFYENFLAFNKERLNLLKNLSKVYDNLIKDIRANPAILYSMRNIKHIQECDAYRQMIVWGIKKHDIAPISSEDLNFLIIKSSTIWFKQKIALYEYP